MSCLDLASRSRITIALQPERTKSANKLLPSYRFLSSFIIIIVI